MNLRDGEIRISVTIDADLILLKDIEHIINETLRKETNEKQLISWEIFSCYLS